MKPSSPREKPASRWTTPNPWTARFTAWYAGEQDSRYYARLPEVRYRVMPEIVRLDMYDFKGYAACGIEPTGREGFAEVKLDDNSSRKPENRAIDEMLREVAAIPASAVAQPYEPEHSKPLSPDCPARRDAETSPGFTRRAVASALSSTIDPVLTVVSSTAFVVGSTAATIVASPFLCVYFVLAADPAECIQHPEAAAGE